MAVSVEAQPARAKATPVSRERFQMMVGGGRAWPGDQWAADVTNVVNLRPKTLIFSEKALGLTTFVTTRSGAPQNPSTTSQTTLGVHRARLRRPWAVAGPGRASRRSTSTRQHTRPHRCEGRRRDLPRCPWAAAGPGRASRRRAERSSQRGRLAGGPPPTGTHSGRALRRPEHPWAHNTTRPRPVSRPRPRHAHAAPLSKAARRRSAPFTTAPPAIRRSCPRDPRPRRGQPRGGRRGRGTGSRTRSPGPQCGRSGSTAGRHRAHHTRRA